MKSDELLDRAHALGFSARPSVRWLAPSELARTGLKVLTSSGFVGILDKRELQATLEPALLSLAADDSGGAWLDYVADVGDGFDATYTVAALLAAPELTVEASGAPLRLPRGDALVMGGDEVYPTPSAAQYDDRLRGPYRAALPEADPKPMLLALPGNHDWYDGLTAFLRVFGQKRTIGGWQTAQSRSYFVLELPDHWWLVGLDTQLGTELDDPQRLYFRQHLTARLKPGDGVIVCAPSPTWVYANEPARDPDLFNSLNWFDRTIVRSREEMPGAAPVPTGASVRLWLSGDQHHYARYAPDPGQDPGRAQIQGQFITCGLGGAFLASTHRLPPRLQLPHPQSRYADRDVATRLSLQARYPDAITSRRQRYGVFSPTGRGIPGRNPGFWRLAGFVHGGLFLFLAGLLGLTLGRTPSHALRFAPISAVRSLAAQVLVWFVVAAAVWALQPVRRLKWPKIPRSGVLAALGVSLQVGLAFAGLTLAVIIPWPDRLPDWGLLAISLGGAAALTGWLSGYALALTALFADDGVLAELQMSAQAIEDYKGFLRIRIEADGALTVYPLAIDRVCRDWQLEPAPAVQGADQRPVPSRGLPRPKLVEPPIVIRRIP